MRRVGWMLMMALTGLAPLLAPEASEAQSKSASGPEAPLSPRDIYKAYAGSVVLVFATDGSARGSAGTGSIISESGHVLTNAHVIAPNQRRAAKTFVYLKPERLRGSSKFDLKDRRAATILDLDHDLDLALLKIVDGPVDRPAIPLADSADVEVGEPVVAIGHPETGGLWTLTTGSVSTVIADFQGIDGKDVFQTEASVNRGNSGGPLLNAYGQLVGVNTSISRKASDGLAITDINFSLKASVAKAWMKRRKLLDVAYAPARDADDRALALAGITPVPLAGSSSGGTLAQGPSGSAGSGGTSGALASAEGAGQAEASSSPRVVEGARVHRTTDERGQTVLTVESESGEKLLVVVEPQEGVDVAEDPEFARAVDQVYVASRDASEQGSRKKSAKAAEAPRVEAKQLTPPRPYRMETLVEERLREIRELEDLMDDARQKIEQKSKTKKKKTPGLGLW